MAARVQSIKEISVREPEESWCRDGLIGGKVTLTLTLRESWKEAKIITLQKLGKDPKFPQNLGSKVHNGQTFRKSHSKNGTITLR
jgi:hypothetical protein